ncbi:MAG: hypothetical protein R3250_15730 [Melioribacteraceae bacterium]|nr:hypothetical protein [Melioribacteraceae bacterium]
MLHILDSKSGLNSLLNDHDFAGCVFGNIGRCSDTGGTVLFGDAQRAQDDHIDIITVGAWPYISWPDPWHDQRSCWHVLKNQCKIRCFYLSTCVINHPSNILTVVRLSSDLNHTGKVGYKNMTRLSRGSEALNKGIFG